MHGRPTSVATRIRSPPSRPRTNGLLACSRPKGTPCAGASSATEARSSRAIATSARPPSSEAGSRCRRQSGDSSGRGPRRAETCSVPRPPGRGGAPPPRQPARRPPPRRAPPAAAPAPVPRPPAAGTAARSARSARRSGSLDDVLLDRLDRDALGAEPLDGGVDLLLPAVELEGDDADLLADARAAHVEHQVELPAHLVDERLLHELLRVGEVELPARDRRGLRLGEAWRRPLHGVVPPSFCQPTHRLVER